MIIKKGLILSIFMVIFSFLNLKAQDEKSISDYFKYFSINGYLDAYYTYDSDKDKVVRQFSSISPERDQFKINTAQISVKYNSDYARAVVTFHAGDLAQYNWPSEQRIIQEANLGFRPVDHLWIDMGYFFTHMGTESALPKNNFFNTLALISYFEPFYQSGIKVTYDVSEKFYAQIHLLNGYNVFSDNNKNKSFGMQLGYKVNDDMNLTYNNIIGNEMPSSVPGKTRFANNFVFSFSPSDKIDFLAGVDICSQQNSKLKSPDETAILYGGLISARYKVLPVFNISGRLEYYNDADAILSNVIADTDGNLTGLKAFGVTLGTEYRPIDKMYVRLESRLISSKDNQKIFYDNSNERIEVTLSSGIEF